MTESEQHTQHTSIVSLSTLVTTIFPFVRKTDKIPQPSTALVGLLAHPGAGVHVYVDIYLFRAFHFIAANLPSDIDGIPTHKKRQLIIIYIISIGTSPLQLKLAHYWHFNSGSSA